MEHIDPQLIKIAVADIISNPRDESLWKMYHDLCIDLDVKELLNYGLDYYIKCIYNLPHTFCTHNKSVFTMLPAIIKVYPTLAYFAYTGDIPTKYIDAEITILDTFGNGDIDYYLAYRKMQTKYVTNEINETLWKVARSYLKQ